MSTRRNMLILAAGTALVFAAPAAIAETQNSEAPDVAAPAATVVDTPAVPAPDTAEPTTPAPAATPEPEPTTVPEAEPAPQPETAPAPAPQPEAGPAPDAAPAPDAGPKADSEAQRGSGREPASARRRTGPANESAPADSTDSAPRAAQQVPAEPAPAPGAQGCVISSAGLICPGDPDCVITSSGVSCASDCTITSAGLSCPSGGEVLPNAPVSGGPKGAPKGKPAPDVGVKPEREEQGEGDTSPTAVAPVEEDTTAIDDALPFTGAPLLGFLVVGFALWAGGLLLRRRTSSGRTAVERPGDGEPRALPAAPPVGAGKPGFRWALVLQTLALLAIGMLMSRRTRR